MLPYAVTTFLGAFLLFQVQPLMGKFVLPWFGGGPGVWTTCILFFQILLLAGYAYAHGITKWFRQRVQVWIHVVLLAGAVVLLPIAPGEAWKPSAQGNSNPTLQILILLVACVGLPYFMLSSTGPLLQHWFHGRFPGRSPYRLYALSNLGSLLALASFPFVFEPAMTRKTIAFIWGAGLVVYAVLCSICAWNARSRVGLEKPAASASKLENGRPVPRSLQRVLWILLPATASVLLLAITNKICQDVAAIPFLWVLPLSVYLLSFIVSFDSPRWYRRVPFILGLFASIAGVCWCLYAGSEWPLSRQLAVFCATLFICCMACHGEVYRVRPAPQFLTQFYLCIAAGGALGGVFVALIAPRIFDNYYELHWGLLACPFLVGLVCAFEGTQWLPVIATKTNWAALNLLLPLMGFAALDLSLSHLMQGHPMLVKGHMIALRGILWSFAVFLVLYVGFRQRERNGDFWRSRLMACLWLGLGTMLVGGTLWDQARRPNPDKVLSLRNFYGALTLYEHSREDPKDRHLLLQHGRITHGLQFVDPEEAKWPTTYYGPESGVGVALNCISGTNRNLGIIGLGAGTLACFARPGDSVRFYEINPDIIRVAGERFTYLRDCLGKVELILGDARLCLERESPRQFDLLAVDAFSGDSIPAHLLTREAFELYRRHLKPNGILAVHISNHYLDLEPVVLGLAQEYGYGSAIIDYDEVPEDWWLYASTWVLLTNDTGFLRLPGVQAFARSSTLVSRRARRPWTDDFTSLFQVLR
jgi:SAM-dependent methyltransferase